MTVVTITLTDMQQAAVDSIEKWYKYDKEQTYFLAGYAGTGKSTLVQYAINKLGLNKVHVAYACYTGKAALVLTQKSAGDVTVETIHKLIYKFDDSKAAKFVKKKKHELSHVKLIVIDEASMVDGTIMKDLRSFGKKILFIGDQGQLPPVSRTENLEFLEMFNNPNFELTEIHRQAEGNPIIRISMLARTGQPIPYGWHGDNKEVLVINKTQWSRIQKSVYGTADQIICGYNNTRKRLNKEIRNHLGFTGDLPQKGDKLICARNNWDKKVNDISLVNGMTGYVEDIKYGIPRGRKIVRESVKIKFRPDFTEDCFKDLYVPEDQFTDTPYQLEKHEYKRFSQFDYGYVITCHKSQGSQWDNIVVINEVINRETHAQWLYTAVTRAGKKLILVI